MVKASALVIGILIVGFLVTGFYSIVDGMANSDGGYDVEVDTQYTAAFDKSQNVSEEIRDGWDDVTGLSANQDSALQYIKLVPETAILIKNIIILPFSIVGGMIESIVEFMMLPDWVTTFLQVIATILFMFAIVAIILRFRHV